MLFKNIYYHNLKLKKKIARIKIKILNVSFLGIKRKEKLEHFFFAPSLMLFIFLIYMIFRPFDFG